MGKHLTDLELLELDKKKPMLSDTYLEGMVDAVCIACGSASIGTMDVVVIGIEHVLHSHRLSNEILTELQSSLNVLSERMARHVTFDKPEAIRLSALITDVSKLLELKKHEKSEEVIDIQSAI